MTNLEMVTELTEIINNLLASGINSCNVHEAKMQLDYLFDEFEEGENENAEADENEAILNKALIGIKENGNAIQYIRIIENGYCLLAEESEFMIDELF